MPSELTIKGQVGYMGYVDGMGFAFVPEVRLDLRPMRGYSHTLAVVSSGAVVGWLDVDKLGYPSVKAWMLATKYEVKEP